MKKHHAKKPTLKPMLPPIRLGFQIDAMGKVFEGTLAINAGFEVVTLPMGINSLMVNFAEDYPQIRDAKEMSITAFVMDADPESQAQCTKN